MFRIVAATHHDLRQLIGLGLIQEVSALRFELLSRRHFNWGINDNCLFGRANGSVVKTLAGQNVLHGFSNIGGPFDQNRHVTRPNTKRRLA